MNIKNNQDWLSLKKGSTVSLSDEQSLLDSKKRGLGLNPLNFTVERVSRLQEFNNLATWIFADINDGVQPLLLMGKFVDDNVDFRIYYQSEDFAPITRQGAINNEMYWLFQKPEDENNLNLLKLKYTNDIEQTNGNEKINYSIKPQGELSGLVVQNPPQTGLKELLGTVVEYGTKVEAENPELMLLEIGDKLSKQGGEIRLFFGTSLKDNEIQVLDLK